MSNSGRLSPLVRLFVKLGFIGVGGPAAVIAMMEDEVVTRRKWLTREHYLDLIGATNLIPGPNSTEVAMHVGYERAGFLGLVTAGICFILPAALMTGTMGFLYLEYGALPAVEVFLVGVKPAVIVIIVAALWKLGKTALKGWEMLPIGLGVLVALFMGVSPILALVGGGILGTVWLRIRAGGISGLSSLVAPFWLWQVQVPEVPVWKLGAFFLKVGSVLYGSGYVLVAFLEGDLVERYQWLTQAQLLDAVALGQVTPGPVLTTATFIGVLLGGIPGGAIATLAIFLPSFVFVAILNPIIPKLRQSAVMGSFLDAINISAVAMMLFVTYRLGVGIMTGWLPWVMFVLAAVAVFRYRVSAVWIVLGSCLLGYGLSLL